MSLFEVLKTNFEKKEENLSMRHISPRPTKQLWEVGTEDYQWYLQEDYLSQWNGQNKVELVKEMINDATIAWWLRAIKSPVLWCNFYIQPAVNEEWESEDVDMENAKFVEDNIFGDVWMMAMHTPFQQWLREVLTCLEYGWSAFEKIWAKNDRWIYVKNLMFLEQDTVEAWQIDSWEKGIRQTLTAPADSGANKWNSTTNIPLSKILLVSYDRLGNNYEGVSMIRPAYRMWYMKNKFYDYLSRMNQRLGGWILQGWLPNNATDDDKSAYKTIMEDMSASIRNWVLNPWSKDEWYELEWMDARITQGIDMRGDINHLNEQILNSMLAGFLNFWSGDSSGNRSLGDNMVDFFMKSENALASLVCDLFNRQVMTEYSFLNWWERSPILIHEEIKASPSIQELAQTFATLIQSWAVGKDNAIEEFVRDRFWLPPMEELEEQEDQRKENNAQDSVDESQKPTIKEVEQEEVPEVEDIQAKKKEIISCYNMREIIEAQNNSTEFELPKARNIFLKKKSFEWVRPLTFAEKKVNLWWLDEFIRQMSEKMKKEFTEISQKQKDFILEKVKKSVEKNDITILEDITIPWRSDLISLVTQVQKDSFEVWKSTASEELNVEIPKTSKQVSGVLRSQTSNMVDSYIGSLYAIWLWTTIQNINKRWNIKNTTTTASMDKVRSNLDTYTDKSFNTFNSLWISGSINTWRTSVFESHPEKIKAIQYSAILDNRTTNLCKSLDWRVVKPWSDDFYNFNPPNHQWCRSIWVEILTDEEWSEDIQTKPIPSSIPRPTGLNDFRDLKNPEIIKDSDAKNLPR